MDCQLIEPLLVDFHFGTCSDESGNGGREAVETHLLSCMNCLRAYLVLKRNLESPMARNGELRPSAALRERLRRDVAIAVAPTNAPLRHRFRRAPAIATAVLTAAAALLFMLRPHPRSNTVEIWKSVDSASPVAASLNYF